MYYPSNKILSNAELKIVLLYLLYKTFLQDHYIRIISQRQVDHLKKIVMSLAITLINGCGESKKVNKLSKSIGNLQTISPVLKATIRDSIQKINFFLSIPILFQDWKIVALESPKTK